MQEQVVVEASGGRRIRMQNYEYFFFDRSLIYNKYIESFNCGPVGASFGNKRKSSDDVIH